MQAFAHQAAVAALQAAHMIKQQFLCLAQPVAHCRAGIGAGLMTAGVAGSLVNNYMRCFVVAVEFGRSQSVVDR